MPRTAPAWAPETDSRAHGVRQFGEWTSTPASRAGWPPQEAHVRCGGRRVRGCPAGSCPVLLQRIPIGEGEVGARHTVADLLKLLIEDSIELGIELTRGCLELTTFFDCAHDQFVRSRLGLVCDKRALHLSSERIAIG